MAKMILGEAIPVDLGPFAPDRFSGEQHGS
jgi:hypothetical protein